MNVLRQLASTHLRRSCLPTTLRHRSTSVPIDDPTNLGTYNVIIPEEPYTFGVKHILPRPVPPHIVPPPYVRGEAEEKGNGIIPLGGIEEERVRQAAALARDARIFAGTLVKSGITTEAIDELVHEFIVDHGAYPSPLLYKGFPKAVCTSVNNIIAHGIPDARPLMDGDIVNIDVTVYLNGYHGDTSQTYLVGNVDEAGRLLCEITNAALAVGIKACGPGRHFRDIGNSIHELLKRPYHGQEFSTSPSFTGHGIATAFHTRPWIYHTCQPPSSISYHPCRSQLAASDNEEPDVMKPGHCFTIEPPIIHGHDTRSWIWPDDWTASTENCARSAQAEHMVLITETGADVLTA